jgi:hypothetical protein
MSEEHHMNTSPGFQSKQEVHVHMLMFCSASNGENKSIDVGAVQYCSYHISLPASRRFSHHHNSAAMARRVVVVATTATARPIVIVVGSSQQQQSKTIHCRRVVATATTCNLTSIIHCILKQLDATVKDSLCAFA